MQRTPRIWSGNTRSCCSRCGLRAAALDGTLHCSSTLRQHGSSHMPSRQSRASSYPSIQTGQTRHVQIAERKKLQEALNRKRSAGQRAQVIAGTRHWYVAFSNWDPLCNPHSHNRPRTALDIRVPEGSWRHVAASLLPSPVRRPGSWRSQPPSRARRRPRWRPRSRRQTGGSLSRRRRSSRRSRRSSSRASRRSRSSSSRSRRWLATTP